MGKRNYSESEKIELLNKCVQWRYVDGKNLEGFTKEFNISKASLYNWSKELKFDINQGKRARLIPVINTDANSFVKISDLPKSKEKIEKKANISIKTKYCEILIPEGLSKGSIILLLESLKEVN